jgi:hypothetical protein
MAQIREYAYYIKGERLAIVEREVNFDNDPDSRTYGPGVDRGEWKSPLATTADGIKLEYTYAPEYFINETDDINTEIDSYKSVNGYLTIADTAGSPNDYSASPESLAACDYIVLENAGRFNGMHKIKAVSTGVLTLETKYSGSSSYVAFEEAPSLYWNINALNDDEDELDLPVYLEMALIYYMKAKLAEDMMDHEGKAILMRDFNKMLEKHAGSRIWGAKMIASGPYSIR